MNISRPEFIRGILPRELVEDPSIVMSVPSRIGCITTRPFFKQRHMVSVVPNDSSFFTHQEPSRIERCYIISRARRSIVGG